MESPNNTPELDPSSEEEPVQPAEDPLQLTPDHDKNVLTNVHQTPLTPKARPETVHQDHRPTAPTSCTPDRITPGTATPVHTCRQRRPRRLYIPETGKWQ